MANYRAVATGNWSSGATWGGGAVPPDGQGHNIYSNGFTVTIDQNVDVALITNAAITATFVGGGTSAAVGGGFNCSTNLTLNLGSISLGNTATSVLTINGTANLTITANIPVATAASSAVSVLTNTSTGIVTFTGNINGGTPTFPGIIGLQNASNGTINIYGNLTGGIGNTSNAFAYALQNSSANGTINVYNGTITAGTNTSASVGYGISNSSSGIVNLYNCIINAGLIASINNSSTGTLTAYNCVFSAINSSVCYIGGASSVNRLSGTFVNAPNGLQAIGVSRWFLFSTPSNAYIQHALDGTNANSFVRYYTSDNALGQANPTDVRTGVSYASGSRTGRLTIPAEGTVANGVTVGPSMPITATRSGTTATAYTAYPYPYVSTDTIVVTGASNTEWNDTYNLTAAQNNPTQTAGAFNVGSIYTIASLGTTNFTLIGAASNTVGLTFTATGAGSGTGTATLSGSILTFPVPASHSASAGSGANAQTVGQAMLTVANVQAALTAQGFTSARAVNLDNLDSSVSSRLATSGYTAPTAPPTAAANASAVWSAATRTVTGGTVDTLTNAPASVTPSDIWSHASRTLTSASGPTAVEIRQEMDSNSTKLANLDTTVSSRLATAGYTAPTTPPTASANASAVWSAATRTLTSSSSGGPTAVEIRQELDSNSTKLADIAAIKATTDALDTARLANVATTNIVGTLLAQSNS